MRINLVAKLRSDNLIVCYICQDLKQKKALLSEDGQTWKGVYFVKTLSLISCCALGADRASITICKVCIVFLSELG